VNAISKALKNRSDIASEQPPAQKYPRLLQSLANSALLQWMIVTRNLDWRLRLQTVQKYLLLASAQCDRLERN
jgi:hypothetical protein